MMPRESMRRREARDIQFYRGSVVREYVKKLDLSVDEKSHIQASVNTAKVSETIL